MKRNNLVQKHYNQYPDSETLGSFKKFKYQEIPNPQQSKTKILQVKKQVAKKQREKTQILQQQKRLKEKQEIQKRIKQQIQQKKKQMKLLDLKKQQALEDEKRSQQLALIKAQQTRIRLQQKENKKKQNQKMARQRSQIAYKRLLAQKQEAQYKQKQALYRRQVIIEAERQQRQNAIKRKQILDARKQPQQQQKVSFNDFTKPLGRINYNKNIDYSKTYMHNPIIVKNQHNVQQQQEIYSAIQKARIAQQKYRQKKLERQESQQKRKQKSLERGKQAIKKIVQQKIIENLTRQSQQKLRQYNLQKIQQGKINQYVGLKPGTIQQMELNKKIRNQQQFEEMFFRNPKKLQWINSSVQNHQIQRQRKIQQKKKQQSYESGKTNNKNRIKTIQQSRIPNQSASKYSFEHSPYIFQNQEIKSLTKSNYNTISQSDSLEQYQNNLSNINKETAKKEQNNQHLFQKTKKINQNYKQEQKQMKNKQGRNSNYVKQFQKKIFGQESNRERQKLSQFIKSNEQYLKNIEMNRQKQRRVVFNNDNNQDNRSGNVKLLESFGNKNNNQKLEYAKLNNLCQNRDHSDLDYSEDSEIQQQ